MMEGIVRGKNALGPLFRPEGLGLNRFIAVPILSLVHGNLH